MKYYKGFIIFKKGKELQIGPKLYNLKKKLTLIFYINKI